MRFTGRWHTEGGDHPAHYLTNDKPFIVAFWHQRLLMMPYTWRSVAGNRPFNMLISSHRDGEIISRTIGHFGIATIAGSTGQGKGGEHRQLDGKGERQIAVPQTAEHWRIPRGFSF